MRNPRDPSSRQRSSRPRANAAAPANERTQGLAATKEARPQRTSGASPSSSVTRDPKASAVRRTRATLSSADASGKGALGAISSLKDRATNWASTIEEPQKGAKPKDSKTLEAPSEEQISALASWHDLSAKAFGFIMTFGLALGLCFFLRPSVSQAENRELTKFPEFSVSDLLSGAFTEGISTWYADTYPFRDQLIAVNQAVQGLYGFESGTQMFGSAVTGDDIPDPSKQSTQKKDPVAPETYDSWNLEENIQGQIMQGLYVDNGSVYATYGFTQEAADDYVNAINGAADKLEGTTQVYSILIPNNSGVLLSKDELAALGGSNQSQAIQYYYDSYNDKVRTVPTMQPLLDHKSEYLFFRTDHHWTSLAAYYVYQQLCAVKGVQAHDIKEYQEQDFAPFLGSYYSQLQLESLTQNPDTVQAWIPKGTNDLTYTDVEGNTIEWNVIKDVSEWDQGTQYNCFVGGDQPWAEIHNPQITDGSSCLVVKESYGNAFIPWLVDHYQDVYIVDFRYNNDNVVDICKEKGIDDLILLNNISIIGSVDVAGKIASLL